jgi:hypothetical protein
VTLLPFDVELSRAIERNTSHSRLKVLAATGVVRLRNAPDVCPEGEWLALDYLDWKSGGDTHFAPLASVDGEMNCVGFSSRRRADKTVSGRPTRGRRRPSSATSKAWVPTSVVFG